MNEQRADKSNKNGGREIVRSVIIEEGNDRADGKSDGAQKTFQKAAFVSNDKEDTQE